MMEAHRADSEADIQKYKDGKKEKKRYGGGGETLLNPSAVCRLVISNQSTRTIGGLLRSVAFKHSPGSIPANTHTHTAD